MGCSGCRAWFEGDPVLEAYHDREWCKPSHDDRFQFEMLVLEGASVGLSWSTVMRKREATGALEVALLDPGLVRNRSKEN